MINFRLLMFSLVVSGFSALVFAVVRRTRNLETRRFANDLSAWESEGGNLAPSAAQVETGFKATPDTNQRQS